MSNPLRSPESAPLIIGGAVIALGGLRDIFSLCRQARGTPSPARLSWSGTGSPEPVPATSPGSWLVGHYPPSQLVGDMEELVSRVDFDAVPGGQSVVDVVEVDG